MVTAWLLQQGAGVIPSYEFTGSDGNKAPRLLFNAERFVIPDVDLCHDGARSWLEIKTYHGPAWNRTHNTTVHGIPQRLFDDYTVVEQRTGTPVRLCVLEVETGDLLVAKLANLRPLWNCQCGGCRAQQRCSRKGIPKGVYWPRDSMRTWWRFNDDDMLGLRAAWRSAPTP